MVLVVEVDEVLDVGLVTVVELVPDDPLAVVEVEEVGVAAVPRVVDVEPTRVSTVSDVTLTVDDVGTSTVDPTAGSVAPVTLVLDTVPLDSITLPRTIDTAPHDSANATMRARIHPPINLVQVGMLAV